jgi:hypothetical protein
MLKNNIINIQEYKEKRLANKQEFKRQIKQNNDLVLGVLKAFRRSLMDSLFSQKKEECPILNQSKDPVLHNSVEGIIKILRQIDDEIRRRTFWGS